MLKTRIYNYTFSVIVITLYCSTNNYSGNFINEPPNSYHREEEFEFLGWFGQYSKCWYVGGGQLKVQHSTWTTACYTNTLYFYCIITIGRLSKPHGSTISPSNRVKHRNCNKLSTVLHLAVKELLPLKLIERKSQGSHWSIRLSPFIIAKPCNFHLIMIMGFIKWILKCNELNSFCFCRMLYVVGHAYVFLNISMDCNFVNISRDNKARDANLELMIISQDRHKQSPI